MSAFEETEWAAAFLAALRKIGTVSGAAREVKIGRRTVYDLAARSEEFRALMEAARAACRADRRERANSAVER